MTASEMTRLSAGQRAAAADDQAMQSLHIAKFRSDYPEFRFATQATWNGTSIVAIRLDGDEGMHTLISGDHDELAAELALSRPANMAPERASGGTEVSATHEHHQHRRVLTAASRQDRRLGAPGPCTKRSGCPAAPSTRGTMLDTMSIDEHRGALADRVAERHRLLGLVLPPEVDRAVRTVPRHLFTGEVTVEAAYEDTAVVTKRDERGVSVSSVSAPWLQAMMLGQAGLGPGDSVLEIGSGGYDAALIWEVVGPDGSVTTVDIDPEVTGRAMRCLAEAGYTDVEVICADAASEIVRGRRFDAIIVTAGSWDVSPAWPAQLAEGGRLVVPLRTKGLTRSWVLERQDGMLASRGHQTCGFVPMRGAGAYRGTSVPLLPGGAAGLWLDEGETIDAAALADVLSRPRAEVWTGVTASAGAPTSDQALWLATALPGFCLITASQQALDDGIVALPWQYGTPALVDGSALAYRTKPRPADDGGARVEFGAFAHGPQAEQAARLLAGQISAWDRAGRPAPRLEVYPADTPDSGLPDGLVLDKTHSRFVISWPTAR
jgi:protein-L-isoaspartate(D-aspartate) O-methyltransferase